MIHSRPILFATAAAAALFFGLGAPTMAQSFGAGSPPPQVGSGTPILTPGALRPEDPTHSTEWVLLMSHKEVNTEINLDGHQRDALDQLQAKSREEIMNKMRSLAASNPQEEANETPEERRAQYEQRMAQQRSYMESYPDEMAKRAEGVLKSAQVKRLRELDLQWRGPLALADPKVADALKLNAEQRDKVTTALHDYQAAAVTIRRQMMPSLGQPGKAGGAPAPPSVEEMRARRVKAQKDMDQARQEAGEKALAVLTPEQQKRWQEMLGKPFAF